MDGTLDSKATDTAKNSDRPETFPLLQAREVACHCSVCAVRRHKTPGQRLAQLITFNSFLSPSSFWTMWRGDVGDPAHRGPELRERSL